MAVGAAPTTANRVAAAAHGSAVAARGLATATRALLLSAQRGDAGGDGGLGGTPRAGIVIDSDGKVIDEAAEARADAAAAAEQHVAFSGGGGGAGDAGSAVYGPRGGAAAQATKLMSAMNSYMEAFARASTSDDGTVDTAPQQALLLVQRAMIEAAHKGHAADAEVGALLSEAVHVAPDLVPAQMHLAAWLVDRGGDQDDAALEALDRASDNMAAFAEQVAGTDHASATLAAATSHTQVLRAAIHRRRGDLEAAMSLLDEALRVIDGVSIDDDADADVAGADGADVVTGADGQPELTPAQAAAQITAVSRKLVHQGMAQVFDSQDPADVMGVSNHLQQALDVDPSDVQTRAGLVASLVRWHLLLRADEDLHGASACLESALATLRGANELQDTFADMAARVQEELVRAHGGVSETGLLYELGVLAEGVGDQQGAIKKFKEAVEADPDSWQAHGRLGAALQRTGKVEDLDLSILHFREVLRLQPPSHKEYGHLGVASALQAKGDEECLVHFQAAVDANPANANAWAALGTELLQRGRGDEGEKALASALEAAPDHRVAKQNLAIYQMSKTVSDEHIRHKDNGDESAASGAGAGASAGADASARDGDGEATKSSDAVADGVSGTGAEGKSTVGRAKEVLMADRQMKTSRKEASKAREHLEKAQMATASGDLDEAERRYRAAIDEFSDGITGKQDRLGWAVAHSNFGVFLGRAKGDLEQAVLHGEHAIRIAKSGLAGPDAESDTKVGDAAAAAKALKDGRVTPETLSLMLHNAAEALTRLGRFEELEKACRDVAAFLKANDLPAQPIVHYQLGTTLMMRPEGDKVDEALDEMTQSLELQPNFAPAHLNVANIYMRKHAQELSNVELVEKAERHARDAVKLDPDGVDSRSALAEVLFRMVDLRAIQAKSTDGLPPGGYNDDEKAIEREAMGLLREALTAFPDAPGLHFLLGRRLSLRQRHEAAVGHLRKALEASTARTSGGAVPNTTSAAHRGAMHEALALTLMQWGPEHADEALHHAREASGLNPAGPGRMMVQVIEASKPDKGQAS